MEKGLEKTGFVEKTFRWQIHIFSGKKKILK
jgi:hypothetical protein